ncbi:MAG: hypothetical protein COB41_00035 [Proteobacteria bacterium]|nr:MAG: hypothetical protein COB41_00035 [Pseudomonadota bacterium]
MSKKIEVSESELEKIRQLALAEIRDKSARGLSHEAFWSKCVIDSVVSVLKLDIEIKYPDNPFKEVD